MLCVQYVCSQYIFSFAGGIFCCGEYLHSNTTLDAALQAALAMDVSNKSSSNAAAALTPYFRADIFSLGLVLYYLYTGGGHPFNADDCNVNLLSMKAYQKIRVCVEMMVMFNLPIRNKLQN